MIKYIGSKRKLIDPIAAAVLGFGADVRSATDLFSGTSRVGVALKQRGLRVTSNDHLTFAATAARCYVGADAREWREPAAALIAELRELEPGAVEGWFTQAFCRDARYLQPQNGVRVEAVRNAIAERALPEPLEAIALTSLMEAADRVDSTTGLQMAYLKSWAKRSYNTLELRLPALVDGQGTVTQLEAVEAATAAVDVAYLDPPYNQHSYLGNYHVWETLVRWDEPQSYGIANKRIDCKTYKNAFNSRVRIHAAMSEVVAAVRAPELVVSFSDEGNLSREQLEQMLATRGHVRTLSRAYERYVGAKIGIHSPKGKKVGKVSHLSNREMIFLVSPDEARVEAATAACAAAFKDLPARAGSSGDLFGQLSLK